ncbi:MAG TPA: CoA pyrophosphatase [Burkholderiaceae bacterium]|nr:CoA pyrophosphatase [Burkholderiaceae bacterium]
MNSSTRFPRRPLFDPETVPLDPAFADVVARGAPVPAERLRPAALRQRFAAPISWNPELRADPSLVVPVQAPRPAAVLVPLIVRGGDVQVLLTERTAHLNDHAGQISFPGGRVEERDASLRATALRETEEEIGLAASAVDIVGELPEYTTITGYRVTPVVGLIERPFELALDAFEVSEVFEVPLEFLMNPRHHERRIVTVGEMTRTFYAMPYQSRRRYFIWGATAGMLRNLYQFLRA